jgi:hypothetical protein
VLALRPPSKRVKVLEQHRGFAFFVKKFILLHIYETERKGRLFITT